MITRNLIVLLLAGCTLGATADENRVSFPESYRNAFVNYLSLDRVQNPDQFIKLHANDIAMKGPSDDGELADGATIVDEVYAVKKDNDGGVIETRLGRRIPTKVAHVMPRLRRQTSCFLSSNLPSGRK